jgi:hypothetical protein
VTPKTWTAVVVTVADLNQHIRDNLNVLKTSIFDDGTLKLVPHTYALTLLDAANTTSKVVVASMSMPANEMADQNVLRFWLAIKTKNYVSGATSPTIKFEWGASTVTLPSNAWGNAGVENLNIVEFVAMRVGSDLWVRSNTSSLATIVPLDVTGLYDGGTTNANGKFTSVISAPTFTSTQTVGVSVQFPTADVNIYWKSPAGGAIRYPVA